MKKHATLFAVVALTATLVAGCSKKKPEEAKDIPPPVAAKTADDKPAEPVKPAEAAKPAADDKAAPAAEGNVPAECADYKAMIEKLATCNKLPQASRDAFKQSYDAMSSAWANITPEAKAQVAASCKQAADALKQSAGPTCGW